MAFASTCCPEGMGYSMSDSPTGPWVYKGMIMEGDRRSNGNHPGIIDYKGNTYVFGFNYDIHFSKISQHYERRSICVEKLTFNPDGTIQQLPFWTAKGVDPVGKLDPYRRIEAETIAWSEGLKTEKSEAGMYVTAIHDGDYIRVRNVDFKKRRLFRHGSTPSCIPFPALYTISARNASIIFELCNLFSVSCRISAICR